MPPTGMCHARWQGVATLARTRWVQVNPYELVKQQKRQDKILSFLLVTRTGLEPMLPPWKGGVLTAWPTGRIFTREWTLAQPCIIYHLFFILSIKLRCIFTKKSKYRKNYSFANHSGGAEILSALLICRKTRRGFPTTRLFGGISIVTAFRRNNRIRSLAIFFRAQ